MLLIHNVCCIPARQNCDFGRNFAYFPPMVPHPAFFCPHVYRIRPFLPIFRLKWYPILVINSSIPFAVFLPTCLRIPPIFRLCSAHFPPVPSCRDAMYGSCACASDSKVSKVMQINRWKSHVQIKWNLYDNLRATPLTATLLTEALDGHWDWTVGLVSQVIMWGPTIQQAYKIWWHHFTALRGIQLNQTNHHLTAIDRNASG